MRLVKAVTLLMLPVMVFLSCKKNLPTIISRSSLPIDGSQVVPAKTVTGIGTIDIDYNQSTRILSYTINWNNLTGPIDSMHIHGTGARGFNAPRLQNITAFPMETAGAYSGTVLIDGVVFREEELFLGEYYIDIHTPGHPSGEVRGQIVF
jgi:hypothetical protein